MKPEEYILTGAAGHLGSTILRFLRGRDCRVRALILPGEQGSDDAQVSYYRGDVTRPETLEGLFRGAEGATVLHTAGQISIGQGEDTPLWRVNVAGTANVLAQCRRHRIRRMVYVSSVHALPENPAQATLREAEQTARARGYRRVTWVKTGGVITPHGGPGAFGVVGFAPEPPAGAP